MSQRQKLHSNTRLITTNRWVLIAECKYAWHTNFTLRLTHLLSLPRPKQVKDGLQDWLMDQVSLFVADLTGDFVDSFELLGSSVDLFFFLYIKLFFILSFFFALYERGVTRRLKNTVSCPPTVPPLCSLRCSLLKGINTKNVRVPSFHA